LLDNIDNNFKVLFKQEISNLTGLIASLKTPKKLNDLSQKTRINDYYLKILLREAKSYIPTPLNLKNIPDIADKHVKKLASDGIKTTKDLFNKTLSAEGFKSLLSVLECDENTLSKYVSISDLSRINGVGSLYACLLFNEGIKSIDEFLSVPKKMLVDVINSGYKKMKNIGIKLGDIDIDYSLGYAKIISAFDK
jgi:hypothetical protein